MDVVKWDISCRNVLIGNVEIALEMIVEIVLGAIAVLKLGVQLDHLNGKIVPSAPLNASVASRRSTMLLLNH